MAELDPGGPWKAPNKHFQTTKKLKPAKGYPINFRSAVRKGDAKRVSPWKIQFWQTNASVGQQP